MAKVKYDDRIPLNDDLHHEGSLSLLKRTERLVAILDSQPDCVKIISRDYRLMDMNSIGLEKIGARSIDQVRGCLILNYIDGIYHDLYKETVEAAFKGESREIEYYIMGYDGFKRRISQRSAPIFSKDDPTKVIEMVAVARDITEQYQNHMDLVEEKIFAEEAYKVKSHFLATMSHELRTPLNAILGFSEVMKTEQFGKMNNPKYAEYVEDINESGKHLLDLINDVLDISEIEAEKRVLSKEKLSIRDFVRDCINMVTVLAQKKFIVIDIIVLDSLPNILADKRSCKQILINLLSNAIKFSPEGSKIVVSAEREGSFIKVVVKDNGVGISKHHLSEITKPFYRVQENSEIAAAGTGLGLSIVKSLLDAHHCDFNISSAVGKGTTVEFFLPIFE